ncbi:MAG: sialate O-acetylesterase [Planctomycetota bacterium]|nr:sialate O-acetylesterase [Planctomycetota bacterium]
MHPTARLLLALALSTVSSTTSLADVRLPKVFGDHMVLQQGKPIRVFGWADPGEEVSVALNGQTARAVGSAEGRFRVDLPAMRADGKAHALTVTGVNTITLQDVLLGEVWLCSGQSNMEWNMGGTLNSQEEIAAAEHPGIRLFNVPGHISSPTPNEDAPGTWQLCSPGSVAGFSAVGFFYGRRLHAETGVPIGLIGTNWGGTRIEPWTPPVGFDQVPELSDYRASLREVDPATTEGHAKHERHLAEVEAWLAGARQQLAAGKRYGDPPRVDNQPKGGATTIYNGMVHGLAPFSVRGAIWYQGESNAGDGLRYADLKRALVRGWRSVFEDEALSFYWVQLANFQNPSEAPAGGGWGPVREGQRLALDLPHTGMATIIDIGQANDIHPRNKQDVGERLARWALRDHYGQPDLVPCGPLYAGQSVEGAKVRVRFSQVGSGLMIGKKAGLTPTEEDPAGSLGRFAIAGADKQWHWAEARIDGDTVLVWSEAVPAPVAVRYAYESNPVGAKLYNREGLPASPFRTDRW